MLLFKKLLLCITMFVIIVLFCSIDSLVENNYFLKYVFYFLVPCLILDFLFIKKEDLDKILK